MIKAIIKKLFLSLIVCHIGCILKAQDTLQVDTSYWAGSGTIGLNFAQVGLKDWAGGGESSIAYGTLFNYKLKHERDVHLWQNNLEAAYGIQRLGGSDNSFRKTDDYVIYKSQYGLKLKNKWYFSALLDFRSQITRGYSYKTDPTTNEETREKISAFLAPGYLKSGLGLSYKKTFDKKDFFSFSFSAATGKFTFVIDDDLSAAGSYGVDPGEKVRSEFGTNLAWNLQREILKNVSLQTHLALFSGYESYGNIDVNGETLIVMKVNDFITTSLSAQLIYDDDIVLEKDDGEMGRAVQFKNALNVGFAYKF
ncbi:DUF3078 domain-containing protein [Fulvivirgaceae bacterium BMA10]|uniref:DUF3078 domain-containing protein n=1 Tax=Splendidivirga corallicola TaxID=3051826 RepID=A0ABT8KLL8_9BACT|nr:DUF3078 domain-containing protein [Fulvivirgaceae bacterium BMA10]